ncbi:MAG: PH domain-containing protein [Pirellulales bacterium]|nr:PH domain-containing protein [Pirellulales bacterium]
MHCPQCKTEIADESLFCNKCGERLDPAAAGADADPPPAAETPAEKFREAASSRMGVKDEAEVELWRGGYSPKAMIGNWIASGLGGLVLLIVAFLWLRSSPLGFWLLVLAAFLPGLYNLAVFLYRKLSVRYLLTNQRFMHESGILRRVTNRIEVLDMDDIAFEQGLVERMMGVGTVRIHSSDVSHPEIFLRGIENVAEISNLIDNTRRTERRKRGLHIESI